MITASPQPSFEDIVTALEQQLRAEAEAQVQDTNLAQGSDPLRWRRPSLLWPTFTKG